MFSGQGVLKICSEFAVEHPCRNVISIKLQSNFIEITLRYRCSPVNLLHIFRTPFLKNASGRLLLYFPLRGDILVLVITTRLESNLGLFGQKLTIETLEPGVKYVLVFLL